MLDQNQPHSIEHEQGLIGSCLYEEDGSLMDEAIKLGVKPDDFYYHKHKEIFKLAIDLRSEDISVSEADILELSRKEGEGVDVGDLMGIMQRVDFATEGHVKRFAEVVKEKSRLRSMIRLGQEVKEQAKDCKESGDIASFMDRSLQDICAATSKEFNIKDSVKEVVETLQGEDVTLALPWGIPSYDASLRSGGMKPGQVHVLAARPGRGKTTLALNVGGRTARDGYAVGVFSLEMGDNELVEKLVCCAAGVDVKRFEDKVQTEAEQAKFDLAASNVSNWPIYINDETNMTSSRMKAISRNWKRKYDIKLLILDYLQLMKGDNFKESREAQVADISRNIKCIAKELRLPVIVLAQLNRQCEKENRMPILSDLRESGAIEQDADTVTFLYDLEEDREPSAPKDRLRWVRAKQRAGQSFAEGTFLFQKHIGRIGDLR